MESSDAAMTGANFATHLRRIIAFVVDETNRFDRVAAYRELNVLLRLKDTEESVFNVQTNVSILLRLIEDDLNKSASEARIWAMRILSYLMFHDALVECFSSGEIERFVATLAQLTDSAQSEKEFKLSIWCLAIQNLRLSRADVLRVTQVIARALINPFCTTSVVLRILKAFHSMMLKFPEYMCMVRCIQDWFPAAVQHSQSPHSDIRKTSHTLLLDAQRHFEGMDFEGRVFIVRETIHLFVPMLYSLVEDDRLRIALVLWPVALKLLRTKIREDAALLNAVLYIPEKALLHPDSSIRSFGMNIWKNLADVFREAQIQKATETYFKSDWIIRRPINRLLVRPISSCWKQEKCMDVLNCSMATWRVILTGALADYNVFCIAQERSFACAQKVASSRWSRWYDDIVTKPLSQQLSAATFEIHGLLEFVTSIWHVHDCAAEPAENKSSDIDDSYRAVLPVDPIAISFILFDVLSFLEMLIQLEGKSSEVLHAIDQVWAGVCSRLAPCQKEGSSTGAFDSKLVARMTRVCLHFGFGISAKISEEIDLDAVVRAWNNSMKRKSLLLYEICTRISVDTFMSMAVHPQSTISGFLHRYVTLHFSSTCINASQRARLRVLLQCAKCPKLAAMANMIVFLALLVETNASDDESFAMCRRLGLRYAEAFPGFDGDQAFSRNNMQQVQPGYAIMSKMDQIAIGASQASKQVSAFITPLIPSNRSRDPASRRRGFFASRQSDRPNRWIVRHPSAVIRSLFSSYTRKPNGGMLRGDKAQELAWIDPNRIAGFNLKESQARTGPISSPNRLVVTTSTSISPAATGPRTNENA